ncbi:MAG: hypothetical protein HKM24_02340, partial [Gammaproteobacteria bacterium]|nr:hypothetical protein [Gammaproteobacteria bacterium]
MTTSKQNLATIGTLNQPASRADVFSDAARQVIKIEIAALQKMSDRIDG